MEPKKPAIFLHIGAMKTGTTFLQHLMDANRKNLLAAGLLVAGDTTEQVQATIDILGTAKTPATRASSAGVWAELAGRMQAHQGTASVFSMEFLSFAGPKQAARVVDSLEGAEVHIILTVRDATGALPSQWQTHTRSGGAVSWPRFAKGVKKGLRVDAPVRSRSARTFVRTQGIPRMLDAWGSAVPPGRLHVITVPKSGSDPMLLWERFAGVVGVDPAACSISISRKKPSLGYPSADLMRRLNARLGKIPKEHYKPNVKVALGMQILAERAPLEQRAQLDVSTGRFAANWNRRVRRAIKASGADLVGGLHELPVRVPDEVAQSLPKTLSLPDDPQVLAAATTARDGLLVRIQARADQLQAIGAETDLSVVDFAGVPTSVERWQGEPEPVDAAVDEVATLVRVTIELQTSVEEATTAAETSEEGPASVPDEVDQSAVAR